ncbi:MAG: hypothetical protein KAR42_04735 [candidate division Zixibacteria bacterium]|nr:hypothetical protein [candidate division Zixibacteria bacterium]
MIKTVFLLLMLTICFSGQILATDIHITAVTGGVYAGTRGPHILTLKVMDENNQFDLTQKKFIRDKRYDWSTGINIGIVFWPSSWEKKIEKDEARFGVGIGGHLITTKNDEIERIAPGVALHIGDRKGLQVFIGIHFVTSNKVIFPNGADEILVPIDAISSDFIFKDAENELNFFVGLNATIPL